MSTAAPPAYIHAESSTSLTSDITNWAKQTRTPSAIRLKHHQPQRVFRKGTLKLHVPAWGVALVRPCSRSVPHHLDALPAEETIVSGSLEVIMTDRRRCRSISVALQGTCKVWLGAERGWEEDAIFERVVDLGSGTEGDIWLEKGSQSFAFDLVLPGSLATHDYHKYGILSYHLLAIVHGSDKPSSGLFASIGLGGGGKAVWLESDLFVKRNMLVHAITDPAGVVQRLDLRREGETNGVGPWRSSAATDVWSIAAAFLFTLDIPSPSPRTTIFLVRLLLVQSYTITSPRSPNDPLTTPEPTRSVLLYQTGRPHPPGEKFPDHTADSLWRGSEAGGSARSEGLKVQEIIRMPTHEAIRPSTHDGTITPIRVTHHLDFQLFYSVEGELADGRPCEGPGELRMMQVRTGIMVPSCCCTISSLDLPPYTQDDSEGLKEFDQLFQTPAAQLGCMCGCSTEELSEPLRKRMAVDGGGVEGGVRQIEDDHVRSAWKYTDNVRAHAERST